MTALPVTIIGGYLGAGKTTLVNQMLRQANGARLAVLVNEFGELPIDEDLIEARDEDLISIAGGCICCSFGNDLIEALGNIAAFTPRPDHIVIEASGVALPASIASTIDLVHGLCVKGVSVLADAQAVRKQAIDEYIGDTIERQLSDADLIVITKSDLVSEAAREDVAAWICDRWPKAKIAIAARGHVLNEVLLGRFPLTTRVPQPHADDQYDSVVLACERPCDPFEMLDALQAPALGLVRVKGFVDDLDGRRTLIQIAGGETEVRYPRYPGPLGVICIGLKGLVDKAAVRRVATAVMDVSATPSRT